MHDVGNQEGKSHIPEEHFTGSMYSSAGGNVKMDSFKAMYHLPF